MPITVRFDCHLHTNCSPCGQGRARLATVVPRLRAAGTQRWAVTDHLFTQQNEPALAASRRQFDTLEDNRDGVFGIEACVLREYDHRLTRFTRNPYGYHPGGPEGPMQVYLPEALLERLRVRYVIAGAHWPLGAKRDRMALVRNYHRQNMLLAVHPRVDVISHLWWWRTKYISPCGLPWPLKWLEDLSIIPQSMHDEFAAATIEHGTRIEINTSVFIKDKYSARWYEQYLELMAAFRERGCRFALGSDSHSSAYRPRPQQITARLERFGFRTEDFWEGPA